MVTQTNQKWNRVLLKDAVTFKTGKLNSNAATKNGKYPFFTCSQEIFRTDAFSFDTECVLLGGNNANAIYPIFYFKGKFNAYQRTYVIESKENNVRFLYYLLTEKLNELRLKSTGSATKFLTLKILNQIPLDLPNLSTQKQIAELLATYDDLIENGNQRIKTLEEIAEKIYNEWFVRFNFPGYKETGFGSNGLPKGWEFKNIVETEIFRLCKNRLKSFTGEKMYIDTSAIDGTNVTKKPSIVTFKNKPSRAQFLPTENSVWFARMSNTYKVLVFTSKNKFEIENYVLSSGMLGIETELRYLAFLFFSINSKLFHKLKDKNATGSTQISLTNGGFNKIESIIPSKELIERFSEIANPFVEEILFLQKENRVLKDIRDLLIPQLITGKIAINV